MQILTELRKIGVASILFLLCSVSFAFADPRPFAGVISSGRYLDISSIDSLVSNLSDERSSLATFVPYDNGVFSPPISANADWTGIISGQKYDLNNYGASHVVGTSWYLMFANSTTTGAVSTFLLPVYYVHIQKSAPLTYVAVGETIDWGNIFFPLVYSASSSAIAASSTLWGAFASTSLLDIPCNTGNIFGDPLCKVGAYLFVPNPEVLNGFSNLPAQASVRFPFSWLFQTYTLVNGFTASSSSMVVGSINFSGDASTTAFGAFMPSFTFFSTSTIMYFMPSGAWSALQALMVASLWLGLFAHVVNQARRRVAPTQTP